MRSKLIPFVVGSTLLLTTVVLRAEESKTTPSANPPRQMLMSFQAPSLIPPRMVERLNLTDEQKEKLKVIEENYAKAAAEYRTAHQVEIDAARQEMEKAQQAMAKAYAGMQDIRKTSMGQFQTILTDEQKQRGSGGFEPPHGVVKEIKKAE